MAKIDKTWQPCPRCKSVRIEQMGGCFMTFLGGFSVFGVGIVLLFIIPPLGIIVMLLGVFYILLAPLSPKRLKCKDCGNVWKWSKK